MGTRVGGMQRMEEWGVGRMRWGRYWMKRVGGKMDEIEEKRRISEGRS